MSRWGPPKLKTVASESDLGLSDTDDEKEEKDDKNLNRIGASPLAAAAATHEEFELIDAVEWGPRKGEEGYDTDQEMAPRPRRQKVSDGCGCFPPKTGMACIDDNCILYACREECRSNCEAGPICGNKRLQKREYRNTEVFDAGVKGKGLRLVKDETPTKKGDLLCEYTGRAIREGALNRLFRRYQLDRQLYIMSLGDGIYVDARHKGGLARYINHSCRANCKVELWNVKGVMRAAVVALGCIQPGEELTFDYQWERKRGRAPTKCHCGMPECRGTLEMPKSLEEEDLQREYQGHWEQASSIEPDESVVNRTVQVYSKEHEEYFLGEVTGYNEDEGVHSILYRHDMKEVWEDLGKLDWMILNEKVDLNQTMIAKKAQKRRQSPTSSLLVAGAAANQQPIVSKNYVYVQTVIKEGLWAQHLIERCQRNCKVQVDATQMARPPLPPNPEDAEDMEKYAALDKSPDGTVWKLTIQGSDISRAHNILRKNADFLERKYASEAATIHASPANTPHEEEVEIMKEVIFPRGIAGAVKRELPAVQERCKNVNLAFTASESKSKQFSRLHLEGHSSHDVEAAKEHLWTFFLGLCTEADAPVSHNKIPRNLGFLGGTLTSQQFNLLLSSNSSTANKSRRSLEASEDLNVSPFLKSFESTYNCTVWVQSQEDQGRIKNNRIVGEATPDSPRKVYFGCKPSEVSRLTGLVQSRADELARGVKYIHLGGDRVYMKMMTMNGGRFFDFVKNATGATVKIDPMTGDHLRVDGRPAGSLDEPINLEAQSMSDGDRAALADEIVRLQVECFRDECIRQQSWVFGRDWALSAFSEDDIRREGSNVSIGLLDKSTASHCGMEIAETVSNLKMDESIAGHAAIILYRFVHSRADFSTQVKLREAALACIFLASKAQKAVKWKRLDAVLEAGYSVFYPGATFDVDSEETSVLADRVLAAEAEILDAVDTDIFWKGIEGICVAALGGGGMHHRVVRSVFHFVFSGRVLAAGAELWLKYGIEYIFAAAAAFLPVDPKFPFEFEHLLSALSLIPLKVSQAAKIIVECSKFSGRVPQTASNNSLAEKSQSEFMQSLPEIEQKCLVIMASGITAEPTKSDARTSPTEHRYRILGDTCCQRLAISGVRRDIVKQFVFPFIESIAAASSCKIYVNESSSQGAEDIVMEGSWRSIAIADRLIRLEVGRSQTLPRSSRPANAARGRLNEQAKALPGLLNSSNILIADCGKETTRASIVGGKCCLPGKVGETSLRKAGLRWWFPSAHGACQHGSICEMSAVRSSPDQLFNTLAELAKSVAVDPTDFPLLASRIQNDSSEERFMPVSFQRWPPEKVGKKESEQSKKLGPAMGYSAAALQELQILTQLHGVVPSPYGHPNFILPVSISLSSRSDSGDAQDNAASVKNTSGVDFLGSAQDPIYSLFLSSEEKLKAEERKKQVDICPNIVFQRTPFVLQRFMSLSRKLRGSDELIISDVILEAWFHDCLSILVHCHSNHVLLRNVLMDVFVVDQSGVVKLGAMYRSTMLPPGSERNFATDPLELAQKEKRRQKQKSKSKNKKGDDHDGDDFSSNPFAAPELLLGCPKHSKATDVWAVGCLLAHLLLGKPPFQGKSRESLLNAHYKIVGAPRKGNYVEGCKFPHYVVPRKPYRRSVEKAFTYLLRDRADKHQKATNLIARMLHLDPRKRCTAEEALSDPYMTEYLEKCQTDDFRQQFVTDWMAMKEQMIEVGEREKQNDQSKKRAAMLMSTRSAAGESGDNDDLYDMDELLAASPHKKKKS